MNRLVLSLFSGVGMLDEAFRQQGYCVVSAGDVLWGSLYDVRRFHAPPGVFAGVIGGPPCQAFSALARLVRANGHEPHFGNLIPEFARVCAEAQPAWFLMENVPAAPVPEVEGYIVREQMLNNRWVGAEQNRLRRFCFGTRDGWPLLVGVVLLEPPESYVAVKSDPRPTRREARTVTGGIGFVSGSEYYARHNNAVVGSLSDTPVRIGGSGKVKRRANTVTSSDGGSGVRMVRYSLEDACELQGLSRDFLADAPFTASAKLKAVANGVSLFTGRAVAKAVHDAMERE